MFIDAHAHLTYDNHPELEPLLVRAKNEKLSAIINVACDCDDLERALLLAKEDFGTKVYTAAALTPHDAAKDDTAFYAAIEKAAKEGHLVAIGETGLDYHYNLAPKEVQKKKLEQYLELAYSCSLPLVIHCRDAFADLFSIIPRDMPVMLHCFTGGMLEAKEAVDRGWYISLSGIVTFSKSVALQEVAKYLPHDRFFIETDSPYLAPQPYRGKQNEPSYLVETAKFVAKLRSIDVETLGTMTSENVKRLFHGIS